VNLAETIRRREITKEQKNNRFLIKNIGGGYEKNKKINKK
jgi:hypothetical protein